jgi:hypothetical protein
MIVFFLKKAPRLDLKNMIKTGHCLGITTAHRTAFSLSANLL